MNKETVKRLWEVLNIILLIGVVLIWLGVRSDVKELKGLVKEAKQVMITDSTKTK